MSILVLYKPQTVLSYNPTSGGSKSVEVITESGALELSFVVGSNSGGFYWELFELRGDEGSERVKIGDSIITSNTMIRDVLNVSGRLRLIVHAVGSLELDVVATTLNGVVTEPVVPVSITADTAQTLDFQVEVARSLINIERYLNKINNHMRVVTGIEMEEGDEF